MKDVTQYTIQLLIIREAPVTTAKAEKREHTNGLSSTTNIEEIIQKKNKGKN